MDASPLWILAILALLAMVAYLPTLSQPFISDDYPFILQARSYGAFSGWRTLFSDPVWRCRATSFILTHWLEHLFGLFPPAFYALSILLHVLDTWLVYALGAWRIIGWRVSALAAAFFAVYEGHQEAVMWYTASNELLFFFLGTLCLLCWIAFIQASELRWRWWVGSVICFIMALASKETAVIFIGLLILPLLAEPAKRRRFLWAVPFVVLGAIHLWVIYQTRGYSYHFHDGSFSLHAPVWITWPQSVWRLFWPWGLLSLSAIALLRGREWRRLTALSAGWAGISLLPYCFLTYMMHVPSRHTYLASAGLAFIVAAGFLAFRRHFLDSRPRLVYASAVLIVLLNCGYLWTRKRSQYLLRAAPTEALIDFARRVDGPIRIPCAPSTGWGGCNCFPLSPLVSEAALELETTKPASALIWSPEPTQAAAEFCFEPSSREQNSLWNPFTNRYP
jgi:hypothetical protein